jgi:hypothetical protein
MQPTIKDGDLAAAALVMADEMIERPHVKEFLENLSSDASKNPQEIAKFIHQAFSLGVATTLSTAKHLNG